MKYLAVIFSVILFKFALAARDECTYGPSYWCSQISKAKKCGAVQHCMQTVWKNQIIKPKDTMQCKLCKIGLDEVRAMLKKNGTEEEIKKYLAEVCHVITNPDMKAKYESAVTKDLPVILDLLKSSMTTEQICATMGLCTGFEDTVQHKAVSHDVKVNTADVCGDCTRFFTDVQNMIISNETQKQIEDLLKQTLCSQLGPVQGMCDFVVDEYIPQILQFMGQTVDPQTACRIIGFCTKGDIFTAIRIRMKLIKLLKQFNQKSIGGQEECDVCKAVMADVQALDRDVTTQDKIKDFVKKELCTRLRELQNDCINLVDEYALIFFELMANELDPETVCSFVGFCRTSLGKTRKQSVEVISLVPATPIEAVKPVKTSGAFCEVCKLAMAYLDKVLTKNATKQQIEAALDEVCSRLPGKLSSECTAFINQYASAILALLEQELDPTVICDKLGLCTPLKLHKKSGAKSSPRCELCEYVMREIDSLISQNKSKEAIEQALDKVCDLMPSTISAECTSFVQQYGPMIIKLLLNEVEPKKVCTLIKLCTSTVKKTLPRPAVSGILLRGEPIFNKKSGAKSSPRCELCEYVMREIDSLISQNKSKEAIEQALDKVCDLMPSTISAECTSFVQQYGPMIIKLLLNEVEPKKVCTLIKLCTSTVKKTLPRPAVSGILLRGEPIFNKKSGAKSSPRCELCEYVMREIDSLISQNKSKEAIEQALDKVCDLMPSTISAECTSFVQQYGPMIIKLLLNEVEPKKVCTLIKLCTSTVKKTLPRPAVSGILLRGEPIFNKKSGAKSSPRCELCEYVMREIDSLISQNKSKEAIEQALDKVCDLMPSTISAECTSFVQQYGPMIIKLLLNEVEPKKVCTLIKLCTSTVKKTLPRPAVSGILLRGEPIFNKKSGAKSSPRCELCEYVMREIDSLISQNKSKEAIEQALDKVCDLMPSTISAECTSFVQQYGPMIIKLLLNEVEPKKVCTLIKLCTSTVKKTLPRPAVSGILLRGEPIFNKKSGAKSSPRCELCEYVMREIDSLISQNKSKAAIEHALDKVCDLMPSTISRECTSFVQHYGPEIIKLLLNEVGPEKVCTLIELCTSTVKKTLPRPAISGILLRGEPIFNKRKPVKSPETCLVCKTVLDFVAEALKENKTVVAIMSLLKKACKELPSSMSDECQGLLIAFGPEIVKMLQEDIDPKQICTELGICKSAKINRKQHKIKDEIKNVLSERQQILDSKLYFRPAMDKLGQKKCSYGPSYWCDSMKNAKECGMVEHCKAHEWGKNKA